MTRCRIVQKIVTASFAGAARRDLSGHQGMPPSPPAAAGLSAVHTSDHAACLRFADRRLK